MTSALSSAPVRHPASSRPDGAGVEAGIVLLGLGRVGTAVAGVLAREAWPAARLRIAGALVRRARESASSPFPLSTSGPALLDQSPEVVVEALGGLEPARTLVLEALGRRIPVVTANTTLLAVHGDELFAAARQFDVALRYEASVIAGVPLLCAFRRRPLAAHIDGVTGILNGTGSDAAEKLAILIRSFAKLSVRPEHIPATPFDSIGPHDLVRAHELRGRLKPIASAHWTGTDVSCFVGPAFVASADPLAGLGGMLSGIRLERRGIAPLHVTGPGAGPEVTARTLLDDVVEVLTHRGAHEFDDVRTGRVRQPRGLGAFITFRGASLPDAADVADLLGAHGIWVQRWGVPREEPGGRAQSALTFPCDAQQLEGALRAVAAASGCSTNACPIVEPAHE